MQDQWSRSIFVLQTDRADIENTLKTGRTRVIWSGLNRIQSLTVTFLLMFDSLVLVKRSVWFLW